MSGWDDPETAVWYEAFCRSYSRYTDANAALVAHAQIEPALRVLDLAAGTGRTADAVLQRLGDTGAIVCVEPSTPMRLEGTRRLRDQRVQWHTSLPEVNGSFDRIVCGAGIWQFEPLDDTLRHIASLLRPGGALCFNIPALYVLEPDEPGGGPDPLLLSLPALLAATSPHDNMHTQTAHSLDRRSIRASLRMAGLYARSWSFRVRLTQDAYAAWLKIPVVSNGMLAGLAPAERARRIDAALECVDRSSWKWERWRGWTAWKR